MLSNRTQEYFKSSCSTGKGQKIYFYGSENKFGTFFRKAKDAARKWKRKDEKSAKSEFYRPPSEEKIGLETRKQEDTPKDNSSEEDERVISLTNKMVLFNLAMLNLDFSKKNLFREQANKKEIDAAMDAVKNVFSRDSDNKTKTAFANRLLVDSVFTYEEITGNLFTKDGFFFEKRPDFQDRFRKLLTKLVKDDKVRKFLRWILYYFKKVTKNSEVNDMNLGNLLICTSLFPKILTRNSKDYVNTQIEMYNLIEEEIGVPRDLKTPLL